VSLFTTAGVVDDTKFVVPRPKCTSTVNTRNDRCLDPTDIAKMALSDAQHQLDYNRAQRWHAKANAMLLYYA